VSGPIRADYNQMYLLPPRLDDWVPRDHPARFLRDFVDTLDLEALGFRIPPCETGRPAYACDLLLKVWLCGYFNGIRSTRSLEAACYEQISFIWLTGQNYPDHNTLWRFWRDNREALREVFRQSVLVACRSNLVGFILHAVDGTKIAAQVSNRSAWHEKDLKKSLKELDESIEEVMKQVETAEATETGEYRLPEGLQDAKRRRQEIKKALDELSASGEDHLHPKDPEARMIKCNEGIKFAYNAQIAVDEKSGLVIAQDVTSEGSDAEELLPMIEQVKANTGEVAKETVADGGYYSPGELKKIQDRDIEVTVSLLGQISGDGKKFHKANFRYDETKDVFVCPLGQELSYQSTRISRRKKYQIRVYRCKGFRTCPQARECGSDKRGRCIEKGEYYEAVMRQMEKQKGEGKRRTLEKRKTIVELPFGHIKEHMGFRRWTVRGSNNVRTQWSLVCTALNLRKLFRRTLEGSFALP